VKFGRKLKSFSETTTDDAGNAGKKLRGEPSAFRKHSLGENRKDIDVDVRRRRDFWQSGWYADSVPDFHLGQRFETP
jgi:hypothetical protein